MIVAGGIAIAVAATEIWKGGSVCAIWTGIVVGCMAGIVARLEAVKARVAVVGALIQNRRDRRDTGPGASFSVLLSDYFYDHRGFTDTTGQCKIDDESINNNFINRIKVELV